MTSTNHNKSIKSELSLSADSQIDYVASSRILAEFLFKLDFFCPERFHARLRDTLTAGLGTAAEPGILAYPKLATWMMGELRSCFRVAQRESTSIPEENTLTREGITAMIGMVVEASKRDLTNYAEVRKLSPNNPAENNGTADQNTKDLARTFEKVTISSDRMPLAIALLADLSESFFLKKVNIAHFLADFDQFHSATFESMRLK